MRQITFDIVNAFEGRRAKKINNSQTDGTSLWLHDNKIAEWRDGEIWITDAGWQSRTTKERLNGLTGVNIVQKKGQWYLNGHLWNGEWVCINDIERYLSNNEVEFDTTSEWNGKYSNPKYSVFHTHVESELQAIERSLNYLDIQTRRMYSDTDGEYKPNHFIIVPVSEFDRAKTLINN